MQSEMALRNLLSWTGAGTPLASSPITDRGDGEVGGAAPGRLELQQGRATTYANGGPGQEEEVDGRVGETLSEMRLRMASKWVQLAVARAYGTSGEEEVRADTTRREGRGQGVAMSGRS